MTAVASGPYENQTDIVICIDCLFYLANGVEDNATLQAAKNMANLWGNAYLTINCPEECDGHFSSHPCDGCGSHLAGDRHPAVAWY